MNMAPMALHGLPKRLVDDHLIEPQDLQVATSSAKTAKLSLVQYLCEKKLVSDTAIANSAAKEFGIPIYSLEHHNNDHIPKDIIDTKLLKKHQVMPLVQRGNRLFVAVADPTNHRALNEIQFQTGIAVEPVLALYSSIAKALEKWLETNADQDIGEVLGTIDDMHLDDLDMEAIDDDDKDSSESNGEDEAPIVRFINKMLIDAIKLGASDIHFEPYEKSYRVRFRVDGILREMAKPPANLA